MSDVENADCENDPDYVTEEEKLFKIELAKTGRSKCKKCKDSITAGSLRIAKMVMNPFGSGKMPAWHHVACLFEAFKKQRATTPKIEKIDDMEGYDTLSETQLEEIFKLLPDGNGNVFFYKWIRYPNLFFVYDFYNILISDARDNWKKARAKISDAKVSPVKGGSAKKTSSVPSSIIDYSHKDNSLREFRKVIVLVASESSYLQKINIMKNFFQKGTDGSKYVYQIRLSYRKNN